MNGLQIFLLAQHNRLDAMSDGFRSHSETGRDDLLIGLLILATVGAGVWAAARLLANREEGQAYDHPWRLFYDLCKVHRLKRSERSLLRRMAAGQGLADPARIFLEAERWEPNRIPAGIRHEYPRLNALKQRLFDASSLELLSSRPPAKLPASNERRQPATDVTPQPSLREMPPSPQPVALPMSKQIAPEPVVRGLPLVTPCAASPLLPPLSSPTLDLPPWTVQK